MSKLKIAIAADHAGFKLKEDLVEYLGKKKYYIKDFGTFSDESVDYPDFGHALAEAVLRKEFDIGISLCGSGNGINMTVNKHKEIRSALCWNEKIAELARSHNNANICALPARFISREEAKDIVDKFLNTPFEGGRHKIRIDKIPVRNPK
ncbi:MAG: ribose 5-phosphate isomerase B [Bacteroidales bacterium]|nr:MAG: ribose 5-phosphate isomerase B [Bacteroidales bacterium]